MKKEVKIIDIDCPNCAQKFEDAVGKIDGVNEVHVNFMTEKMIIDINDELYEEVVKKIHKLKKKIEPDATIIGL